MNNNSTLKDWFIALRPWSFSTSAIPVVATLAFVFFSSSHSSEPDPNFLAPDYLNGFLSLLLIILLHCGGNLISDYYDHIYKVDLPECPNGVYWIASGQFKPREILIYGYSLLTLGALVGILILFRSSIDVLWIGILGIALPLAYPWLKAHALGDIDILLSFAILPAVGTYYVMTGMYSDIIVFLSLPYGLLTISILHANNTRDRANDRRAGLQTLPIIIGWQRSRHLYVGYLTVPYILVGLVICIYATQTPGIFCLLLILATLPIAIRNIRTMMLAKTEEEQDINTLDQMSAQLQLIFGLTYAMGFILAALI